VRATASLWKRLREPTREPELRAAFMAWGQRVGRNLVPAELVRRSIAVVAGWLADERLSRSTRSAAADVLALLMPAGGIVLPPRTRAMLDNELRATVTRRSCVGEDLSRPVLAAALAAVWNYGDGAHDEDPLIPHILFHALFSTDVVLRIYAGNVLAASPFHLAIADRLASIIVDTAGAEPTTLAALATALGMVGDATHRNALESQVSRDATPAGVLIECAWALGHLPGRTPRSTWTAVLHDTTHSPSETDSIHSAVIYAAAMNGDIPLLDNISSGQELPAGTRRAAHWWRKLV
jgi:hypothetical protein